MAVNGEWFYGNATSEIGLINRSFEDIYQENVARMNFKEIL